MVGRYERERRGWPAIALTTDTSALTAISNDLGYEEVFARQSGPRRKGRFTNAISTSAGPECRRAALKARELGCRVIALTGANGGQLSSHSDLTLSVPSARTARVQELHITVGIFVRDG